MTALSKSFGFQGPSRPHLNVGEVKDLREDVEGAFSTSDSRLGFPRVRSNNAMSNTLSLVIIT